MSSLRLMHVAIGAMLVAEDQARGKTPWGKEPETLPTDHLCRAARDIIDQRWEEWPYDGDGWRKVMENDGGDRAATLTVAVALLLREIVRLRYEKEASK